MSVIAFVACVFPAFVTMVAPVSVVRFERRNDELVVARAQRNLLFVVPYYISEVSEVTSADDRYHAGEYDRDRQVRSEDEAFLVIHGRTGSADVPVSPASIRGVMQKVQTFLSSPGEYELRLIVVANWKFSVIAGGLVSLLTLLWIVDRSIASAQFLMKLVRRKPAVPASRS